MHEQGLTSVTGCGQAELTMGRHDKDRTEKIIRREGAGGDRSICAVGDYVNCIQKNRGSEEIPEEDQTSARKCL